ncbi:hypothetical protein Klosneuvirus_4_129 [Klosneuvirus KNV1]|uniref:Uncharacterized protein n=1 Tax=Klosneuvirus KNV1 TaxID=1977640 RepID=A0A1V0SL11_9VIRU|nr:hypothetical protein Klosneuvirus_4_129 [Klosneuvirus KNV1]
MSKSTWTKYDLGCIKTVCGRCNGPWMPILHKVWNPYFDQKEGKIKLSEDPAFKPIRLNGEIDQRLVAICSHCGDRTYEWYSSSNKTRMIQRSKI